MIDPADSEAFPIDPWAPVPPESRENTARLAEGVAERIRHYAAPRDAGMVRDFLLASLPPGRTYLYGAGTATAKTIEWLSGRSDVELIGVIDRNAAALDRFHGLTVLAPLDIAAIAYDRVVILHPLHEPDMAAALLGHGVPAERIFHVYDNPDFAAWALPAHRQRLADIATEGVRYCVIGTPNLSAIPDEELQQVFPAPETVLLFFSPYEPFRASTVYRTVDTASSLTLLEEMLQRLRPEMVVLRGTTHISFLAFFIRQVLPDTVLLHDFYDITAILPRSLLRGWMALSDAQIALAECAEYHSFRMSDILLSKRDGSWWPRVLKPAKAPYLSYYPSVVTRLPAIERASKQAADPWRILYAGILLTPKPGEYQGDYNFLPLFEELAATSRCEIDLYNSAHQSEGQDAAFSHFLTRYETGPVRYHRRVPYASLHAASAKHHFGWIYREPIHDISDMCYDAATGIPARCTGYLSAGLPLILDERWGYLEELVVRHHAGIVIDATETGRLPDILDGCDLERLRAGAASLLRFLIEHNRSALRQLADLKKGLLSRRGTEGSAG